MDTYVHVKTSTHIDIVPSKIWTFLFIIGAQIHVIVKPNIPVIKIQLFLLVQQNFLSRTENLSRKALFLTVSLHNKRKQMG